LKALLKLVKAECYAVLLKFQGLLHLLKDKTRKKERQNTSFCVSISSKGVGHSVEASYELELRTLSVLKHYAV